MHQAVVLFAPSNPALPRSVTLGSLLTDAVPAWTLARARQTITKAQDARPVPGRNPCRMIVRLDGSLAELEGERPAALKRHLSEQAGDETFLVGKVADGGIGLLIATTEAGRARLLTSIESRELTDLDRLPIASAETDLWPDWLLDCDDIRRGSVYNKRERADIARSEPWLIVSSEDGEPISDVRLTLADVDEVLIGRGKERQHSRGNRQLLLALADRQISRLHLRLSRTRTGWRLDDIGSKNGTCVNGQRVADCELAHGDIIEISRSVLVYQQENGSHDQR
jgi:hypothetical protein